MNTNQAGLESKKSTNFGSFLLGALLIFSYPITTYVVARQNGDELIIQKVLTRWLLPPGILTLACLTLLVCSLLRWQKFQALVGS